MAEKLKGKALEAFIEKIKKMAAFLDPEKNNENEAGNAVELISRMLAEQNLTLADVTGTPDDDDIVELSVQSTEFKQAWASFIWGAVADLNFCFHYLHTQHNRADQHRIIGTQANVTSVKIMATYLVDTTISLARKAPISGHKMAAFKLGVASRLAHRLAQLKKDRAKGTDQNPSTGTNLPALADLYKVHENANREYLDTLGVKLGAGSKVSTKNQQAYMLGYRAGGDIGLDTQIDEVKKKAIR